MFYKMAHILHCFIVDHLFSPMFLKLNEPLFVIASPHMDLSCVEEHSRILTIKLLEKH